MGVLVGSGVTSVEAGDSSGALGSGVEGASTSLDLAAWVVSGALFKAKVPVRTTANKATPRRACLGLRLLRVDLRFTI